VWYSYYASVVIQLFGVLAMPEREKPWNTTELAKEAGLSDAYIRQLIIGGKIPSAYKVGRDWLIPAEEGQAWLDKRNEKLKN
jgi:excisionase family DNA binding protein